jgi:hypothetical protein
VAPVGLVNVIESVECSLAAMVGGVNDVPVSMTLSCAAAGSATRHSTSAETLRRSGAREFTGFSFRTVSARSHLPLTVP